MEEFKKCSRDGCSRRLHAKGLCATHLVRSKPEDKLRPLCTIENCKAHVYMAKVCYAHHQELRGIPEGEIEATGVAAIRDDSGRKQCLGCEEWLALANFTRDRRMSDGLSRHCRDCHRLSRLRWRYKVEPPDKDATCDICGGRHDTDRRLHVDHDHRCCPGKRSCGKCVRGFLCTRCNIRLVAIEDAAWCDQARQYLSRSAEGR